MKKTFIALFAIAVLFATQAFAMDLSEARTKGAVGEKLDGYIAVVTPSADATALVNDVNARRRAEYEKISKENSQPVSVVAKVAAENIIKGLPSGSLFQTPNGSWAKK